MLEEIDKKYANFANVFLKMHFDIIAVSLQSKVIFSYDYLKCHVRQTHNKLFWSKQIVIYITISPTKSSLIIIGKILVAKHSLKGSGVEQVWFLCLMAYQPL